MSCHTWCGQSSATGVGVGEGAGVDVGVGEAVGVMVGELVDVGEAVAVGDDVAVAVGDAVGVGVQVVGGVMAEGVAAVVAVAGSGGAGTHPDATTIIRMTAVRSETLRRFMGDRCKLKGGVVARSAFCSRLPVPESVTASRPSRPFRPNRAPGSESYRRAPSRMASLRRWPQRAGRP